MDNLSFLFYHNVLSKRGLMDAFKISSILPCASLASCMTHDLRSPIWDGGAVIVEKYCDDYLKVERFTTIMTFYRIIKKKEGG